MPPKPEPEMIPHVDHITGTLGALKHALQMAAIWIKESHPGATDAECETQLWAIVATGARMAFGNEMDTAQILGDIGGLLGGISNEMKGMAASAN